MDEDHFEVVGECRQHSPMGFEVDIPDGHSAVAQEAKLPLDIQLLQQEQAVAGHLHNTPLTWRKQKHSSSLLAQTYTTGTSM